MTLDPQAKALLDGLAAQGMKGFEEMSVEEARQTGYAFIGLEGDVEPVGNCIDKVVAVAGVEIPLRIYLPAGAGPHPIVMYFHGGGFVFGDLEVVDKVARSLSNASHAAVVSVGYRLAPEHRFPTATEDCYAATQWAVDNAPALGLDATRIAVCGDSAGGNLATVVAMMARDRQGPKIAYQLLIYPVTDAMPDMTGKYPSRIANGSGYLLTSAAMDWFFSLYFVVPDDAVRPYASPIRGVLSGLPPATVITAGFDPLHDEGKAYADALGDAGVPVKYLPNAGMIHGFMWLMGALGHARGVFDEAGRHLRAAFAPPPSPSTLPLP